MGTDHYCICGIMANEEGASDFLEGTHFQVYLNPEKEVMNREKGTVADYNMRATYSI